MTSKVHDTLLSHDEGICDAVLCGEVSCKGTNHLNEHKLNFWVGYRQYQQFLMGVVSA